MENLIEKLKGLDKKVWIGVGIAAAVLILLIVVLLVGSGNSKPSGSTQGSSQGNSQVGTQVGTQAGTEGIGTEGIGTEGLGTEVGTELETEVGTETEMTETEMTESESQAPSSSQTPGVGGTTVTQNPDVNGVEQKPTTGDGTTGMGTKDQPYDITPDGEAMNFTTYGIPAGGSAYYNVMKTVGKYFTIEDPDAYVVYNGRRYDASNGRVSFLVTNEKALSTDFLLFEIGNKGGAEKTFTVKLSDPYGSQMNPEIISGNGAVSTHLNAGDTQGYYYSWKVQQKKAIRIYITAESTTCAFEVTRVRGDIPVQKTFQDGVQEDAKGKYIEFPVDIIEVGDVINIHITAEKYRGDIPAADITWEIVYVD